MEVPGNKLFLGGDVKSQTDWQEDLARRAGVAKEFRDHLNSSGLLDGRELTWEGLAEIVRLLWKIQNLNAVSLLQLVGTYNYYRAFKNFEGDEAAFSQHMAKRRGAWEEGSLGHPGADLAVLGRGLRNLVTSRGAGFGDAFSRLLSELRRGDRFQLVAADLFVRNQTPRMVPASAAASASALSFLRGIEPDGATDLGLALGHAGKLARAAREHAGSGRRLQLVYLGDGTATWGETDAARLRRLAGSALGPDLALHVLMLGKGADTELLRDLAAQQGGRVHRPQNMVDVRRFVLALQGAAGVPRLRQVLVSAGEHDEVYPRRPTTLYAGDQLTVLVRTPPGQTPPSKVTLRARLGSRTLERRLVLRPQAAQHVAHRWARLHIAHLQAESKPREEVVKVSLRHGVMSRHTAFLVLESEEAYKKHQIARRNQKQQARLARLDPRVTGGDLESVGPRQASMSPDHMQPGDPEIRIPAPATARCVVVVFPFGETKVAHYEPRLRALTVRFLIDKETPEGTYKVSVRITHQSGRVELLAMSYVVDTTGPTLKISLVRRGVRYLIRASQLISSVELSRELQRARIAGEAVDPKHPKQRRRFAQLVKDAYRVELRAPDGQTVRMWTMASGEFRGIWKPRQALRGPQVFSVVAVDIAYNRSVFSVTFDPATGRVTPGGVR